MNKILISKKLWCNILLVLFSLQLHSQCPLSFPQSNDWGSWNRVVYDGNWLLNSAGTAYVSTPISSALAPTTSNSIDFGVNDYSGDLNFSTLTPPLSGSSIIRVGKKFNQPGQGLLSPVRRAAVTTFTFTPTQQNCKIKVYYIGMLQEPSSTATYYSTVVKSFRLNTASQPASFGLFCKYNYTSSLPNANSPSRAGSNEFGTVEATSSSTFVNSASNINYGLNDMFSFYQAGTTIKQLPTTTAINKKMTGWDNYVMDFTEFIGTPVTITLFANTSNYAGSSQNHSYCYYQFECLNDTPTTLPNSTLSVATDENNPTLVDLQCLADLPTSTAINITNINPTLLGNLSNVTAVNNNTSLNWLNIIKPLPAASTIYNSNFASVSVDLKDSGGNWNPFAGVSGGADINVAIKATQPTLTTAIANGFNYEYDFKIHYKNWRNSAEQIGYFKIKATVLFPAICYDAPGPITVIDPNSVLTRYNATNYFICKPENISTQDNVTLNLGASNCTPNSPTNFIGYQWQKSSNGGASWANIGTPSLTSLSLVNAQNQVYNNTCSTLFRRVNVTSISCTNTVSATSDTDQEITIWNNGYAPYTASPTLIIHDYTTPSNINTLTNVVLGTKVVVCYGEKVDFTTTLKVGNASCAPPVITSSSNTVSAQLTYLSSTGTTVTLASITNQPLLSGLTSITLPQFSYEALNGNGFNFSGASASVQIPITLTVTTVINGCSSTIDKNFINLQIFPRAVGGAILNPICPLTVVNDPSTPTVAYDANEGNSSLPPNGYDWSYCTNYSTDLSGNYTCNGTWTAIAGQGEINLALWTTAIMGISKPFILKRTAKSGNNCGGAEDSNSILIETATVPNFTLSPNLCRTASGTTIVAMPTATPVVNGDWYEITTINPPVYNNTPITQLNLATLALGAHSYIFIPAAPNQNNNVCYDFVVWNVTLYNTVTPTFTLSTTYCETEAPFDLPTTSNNSIAGTWSLQYNGNTIPVTQWNPALYASYDANNDGILNFTFTATNSSGSNPCNSAVDVNIRLLRTINFTGLPTALCQGSPAFTLPTQSNSINGLWTLGTTVVTQVASTTVGNYTYTYSASNACAPYTYTIVIQAPSTAATLSGNNTIHQGESTTITPSVTGGSWSTSDATVASIDTNGVALGINPGTVTLTYTIPATATCPAVSTTFTLAVVGCANSTTWESGHWSNGTPNTNAYLDTAVIFNEGYTANEDLFACTVLVNNNALVTIEHIGNPATTNTGNTLTVMNEVVVTPGAMLDFKDDTSLVQINDFANIGNIQYLRTTPKINKFDYTYWSSPVDNQTLTSLSPATLWDKFYGWNPQINNWTYTPNSTVMNVGQGYIIRGPQYHDPGVLAFDGFFTGVPHNGPYTTAVYNAASNMNLIGNPYPSGLDIDCFLADPVNAHLNGTVYLWCHNIPIDWTGTTQQGLPGNELYNYNINSYGAYNRMGGVGTGIVKIDQSIISSDRCLGKIGAGQSFFIESTATGVATFKNSMRVGSQSQGNSQFFKSATQGITPAETSTCVTEDRHRLWLHLRNLTAAPQQFKQTLVGYSPLATTSATLDRNYDAKTLVAEPYTINFYSLSPGGEKLTIQGRSLNTSFNVNDVIPLGYNCKLYGSVSNTIQLGISEEDGLFDNQEVYLRINTSGVYSYHNLKAAPYTFTITASMPTDDTTTFAIVFKTPVTTQLNTAYCGKTNIPLNQYIAATGVTGFQGFQWLFIRQSDGAQAIVTTTTTTTTAVFLNNANFPAGYIRYNESYVVRVSVLVAGVWSAYGKPCSITTTSLISSIKTPACNTVLASLNTTITAQSVTTYTTPATIVPTGYHWEVTNLNTSEVRTFDTTTTSFNFNNPALTTPSGFVLTSSPYCIRVRPKNTDGQDNLFYSSSCCFTTNSFRSTSGTDQTTVSSKQETIGFSVTPAPNPFTSGFQLHLITPLSSKVQVELYNSLGQLIVNESYTLDELENHIFGVTLASGVYQAILRQDDYSEVVKVIKN